MTDPETSVDELLGLLGNETRMGIMKALWKQFDFERYVTESREGATYSALFEAADTADKGNFNYHLRQLRGTLVAGTDDGYVLSPLGYNLMSAIDRYDTFEYVIVDERPLDDTCPFCGGTLVAAYSREILSVRCRDCPSLAADGNFTFVEVPVTGGADLDVDELLDAATLSLFEKIRSSRYGVCWECLAPMDRHIDCCADHAPDGGVCDVCDLRYRTRVETSCANCGTGGVGPFVEYAVVEPTVVAFHERHGVGQGALGPWGYRLAAFAGATETVTDTDPVTVEVTFESGGAETSVVVTDAPDGITVEHGAVDG